MESRCAPFWITVSLWKRKLFMGGSCLILVLTNVIGHPRRADAKNDVKNYQGPTPSWENTIRKYQNFSYPFLNNLVWLWPKFVSVLEPRVTSNAPLRFSIFSKPSYFCRWKCVSADKAQLALSAETKFHIQKCNTCRYKRIYREAKSRDCLLHNGTVLSKVVFTAVY